MGRAVYWRLYAIENVIRVLVHSVLTAQVGPDWWPKCVDSDLQAKTSRSRSKYALNPWHSSPGLHDIYHLDLGDLNSIMRVNRSFFDTVISDLDSWIARIEQIRLPRNVVAHMNWPSPTDRKRIDVFHHDVCALAAKVQARVPLLAPR